MADVEHRERMGRELKCPICWSLLCSAVSLVCNHVFCSACISKSMKSASNCPVCKIPYHRRDIRPSLHMDSLVTIYKNMEAASGVNIFDTQREPVKKSPGEGVHSEHNNAEASQNADGKSKSKSKKKRVSKNKSSKDEDTAETVVANPSKKRVHVTPYPVSETPLKSEALPKNGDPMIAPQFRNVLADDLGDDAGNTTISKGNLHVDEKVGGTLCPFFWLREDVDEDEALERPCTQQSEDLPSVCAPCFSDIKSTNEDNHTAATPVSKFHAERLYDSELFEWTQRACSPELCFTPMKNQNTRDDDVPEKAEDRKQDREQLDGSPGSNEPLPFKAAERRRLNRGNGNSNNCQSNNPRKQVTRKRKNAYMISQEKASEKIADVREKKCSDAGSPDSKNLNSATVEGSITDAVEQQNQNSCSPNTKFEVNPNKRMRSRHMRKHTIMVLEQGEDEPLEQFHRECTVLKSRSLQLNDEAVPHQVEKEDNLRSESGKRKRKASKWSKERQRLIDDAKVACVTAAGKRKSCKPLSSGNVDGKESVEIDLQRGSKKLKRQKKVADLIAEKATVEDSNGGYRETKSAAKSLLRSFKVAHVPEVHNLRKCSSISFPAKCAFCQSNAETEVSGNMMHYVKGKPVAADYNGGNNVVHAHKHCTEWAPNVYFEDECAVNLTTEVARSRRIKCSSCGLKGAALGCFEKSCRKSFHYTCAKLIHQCRWDSEHFVMLCPLHMSSKLPSEVPESLPGLAQECQQHQITANSQKAAKQLWKWRSGSPFKCVVCCSALSASEKEIVYEFAKSTGASISKDWSPSVTHVIASADENGACKRTLKFLMAIAEGKWVLRIDWIKACMKAGAPQEEEAYEIKLDVHGVRDGPRLGRLRVTEQEPKIFHGFIFYFSGDFTASFKGYLHDLVLAAGGTVLQRKPVSREKRNPDDAPAPPVFVVYSHELNEKIDASKGPAILDRRKAEAEAIANASGAKRVTSAWILDSVAASKLQSLEQC